MLTVDVLVWLGVIWTTMLRPGAGPETRLLDQLAAASVTGLLTVTAGPSAILTFRRRATRAAFGLAAAFLALFTLLVLSIAIGFAAS